MKTKVLIILSLLAALPLAFLAGCGKGTGPVSAISSSNVAITVPMTGIHGKNFSPITVNVLYYLSGSAGNPVTGIAGTLSVATGSSFTFVEPGSASTYNYVAIQLNDTSSNQTVAIGAVSISSNTVPVTLGPVNKSVYQVSLGAGQAFGFESDAVTNVGTSPTSISGIDIYCNTTSTGFELDALGGGTANVAYLGNGHFLNFLKAPTGTFAASSTTAKAGQTTTDVAPGDVFCVKLATGYAWLQATSVGSNISFQYRVNTTLPYCGYEQTTADLANSGSGNPTATPTTGSAPTTLSATSSGLPVGFAPYDVALYCIGNSAAQTVYASNSANGYIYVMDSGLSMSTSFTGTGVVNPEGMAIDPSLTYLYAADPGGWMVNQFSLSTLTWNGCIGNGVTVIAPDNSTQAGNGALAKPRYVTFDNSGNLFITDAGTAGFADVMEYLIPSSAWLSATTNVNYWTSTSGLSSSTSATCVGQIANAGTTILVADSANNRIGYFAADGTNLGFLTSDNNPSGAVNFNNPQGVAYNTSTGYVYISDTGNNRIVEVYLSNGAFAKIIPSTIASPALNGPTGLKLDKANPPNLYVADTGNGRILKLQ